MLAVPLLLAFVLVPVAADNATVRGLIDDVFGSPYAKVSRTKRFLGGTLNLFNRSSTPGDFFDFVPIGFDGVLPGTTVVFVCNTSRSGSFRFDWYFRPVGSMDGIAGEQLIRSLLYRRASLTNGGSTLTIRSFSSQYTQEYQCIASNVGGVEGDTKWIAVRSAVVPDPPRIVLPNTIRRDFNITLAWIGPTFTGYQPVTSYDIFYQTNHQDSPWNQTVQGGSGFNKVIITPLFPNTDYVFRVRAVNVVGQGNFSEPEQIKTQLAPIDNPPKNFAITVLDAKSTSVKFNVTFTPTSSPCISPCDEEIIGYNLTDVANTITPVSVASGVDMVTLTGLKRLTTYELVVYALNAGPYVSPPSNVQTIRTTAEAPSPPTNVRPLASGTTATSIAFAWDPPLDNGGINVATYKIQYRKESEVDFIDFGSWSGLDATISNLNSSTRYYVEVKANNTYAVGPAGSIFVTTKSQRNFDPPLVEAGDRTESSLSFQVFDSPDNNRLQATEYSISYWQYLSSVKKLTIRRDPSGQTIVRLIGLNPSASYNVQVVARNELYYSQPANHVFATLKENDCIPTLLQVHTQPLLINWSYVCEGSQILKEIVSYVIVYESHTDYHRLRVGTIVSEYSFRELLFNMTYNLSVTAVTQNGARRKSNVLSVSINEYSETTTVKASSHNTDLLAVVVVLSVLLVTSGFVSVYLFCYVRRSNKQNRNDDSASGDIKTSKPVEMQSSALYESAKSVPEEDSNAAEYAQIS